MCPGLVSVLLNLNKNVTQDQEEYSGISDVRPYSWCLLTSLGHSSPFYEMGVNLLYVKGELQKDEEMVLTRFPFICLLLAHKGCI